MALPTMGNALVSTPWCLFCFLSSVSVLPLAACATNCRQGACAGERSYQCLACNDNQILVKAEDGPHAGKPYGTCIECAYTCKPLQCLGEASYQCTACGPGRSLVPAAQGKTYGYCAANSVVKNEALQAQIREQARQIKELKEEDKLKEEGKDLAEARDAGKHQAKKVERGTGSIDMAAARIEIAKQMAEVQNLAHATVFASNAESMENVDLGSNSHR